MKRPPTAAINLTCEPVNLVTCGGRNTTVNLSGWRGMSRLQRIANGQSALVFGRCLYDVMNLPLFRHEVWPSADAHNADIKRVVLNAFVTCINDDVHILTGLSDRSQSGVWQYENSRRPVEYFNWRRNFPRPSTRRTSSAAAKGRSAGGGGRVGIADGCVQVGKRAEWVNKPCGPKPRARFICITETPVPAAERGVRRRSERQSRNG